MHRDGGKETSDVDNDFVKRTLSQDLNRHAAVVLEGRTLDVELGDTRTVAEALAKSKRESFTEVSGENSDRQRLERVSRMTEIEDLKGPGSLPYAPLCIKDPREYFDSQQVNALKALSETGAGSRTIDYRMSTEEVYNSLMEHISLVKTRGFNAPYVQPEAAYKVLSGLTQQLSSTRHNLGKNPQESTLDRRTREEIMHHWSSIQELLQHFWSSYPITTSHLYDKVLRLKEAMTQIYQKLKDMKESVQSDYRHQISLLVQPMLQALDVAFAYYDHEQQKHPRKSGAKPNGFVQ